MVKNDLLILITIKSYEPLTIIYEPFPQNVIFAAYEYF
jgi:hypothetical protein